ncbi:hypothetical protein N7522_013313 [Penicillium canescens]|uniref:Secreted protein n=1 Tax=Penicillium canescens TaxID=5083 RepID=A0AAD6IPI3_PENCN|nr:uncharacterized protein N7446_008711 [Penicillium canescens]KAJ5981685.1 hypothetical protein N7522_013313 [Penicillium canescens]KAJ6057816.1 hypothetical protein N7460_001090 [Penicillium canescens]KAJ6059128.1 hypothetical protein N7446_008711 [Penicillium canescens]
MFALRNVALSFSLFLSIPVRLMTACTTRSISCASAFVDSKFLASCWTTALSRAGPMKKRFSNLEHLLM